MTATEDARSLTFPVLPVKQPIGEFFIGCIDWKQLCEITDFDVRRMLKEKRDFETYLGVQREVKPKRVEEIGQYVNTLDACFPTAIILSVRGKCVAYDGQAGRMTLSNYTDPEDPARNVLYRDLAKVLDGQHRIEGLKRYTGPAGTFGVNVSIFVDVDVAEEGYIFSTVNLAQTKVNKSLAYDLFDLANSPSPQKLCHNVAVALDQNERSPFHKKIKRLGVATEGRFNETLTQATVVEALMAYISKNPVADRDLYLRRKTPQRAGAEESKVLIFRNMMIDKRDLEIVDIIWNYFDAVRLKWPDAWRATGRGQILNKTNGFRGLMRFLRVAYLHLVGPGEVPTQEQFGTIFARIAMASGEFNSDNFLPGTSGEVSLYRALREKSGI
jgi:DGQHR domain-containing protein